MYCTILYCTVLHLVAKLVWHCCSITCSHTTSVSPAPVQPCQLCLNILHLRPQLTCTILCFNCKRMYVILRLLCGILKQICLLVANKSKASTNCIVLLV